MVVGYSRAVDIEMYVANGCAVLSLPIAVPPWRPTQAPACPTHIIQTKTDYSESAPLPLRRHAPCHGAHFLRFVFRSRRFHFYSFHSGLASIQLLIVIDSRRLSTGTARPATLCFLPKLVVTPAGVTAPAHVRVGTKDGVLVE